MLASGSIYCRSLFCYSLRKPFWSWIVPCQEIDLNQERVALISTEVSILSSFFISILPPKLYYLMPQAWPGSCLCAFLNKPFPTRAEPCFAICWAKPCLWLCSWSRWVEVDEDWEKNKGLCCRKRPRFRDAQQGEPDPLDGWNTPSDSMFSNPVLGL